MAGGRRQVGDGSPGDPIGEASAEFANVADADKPQKGRSAPAQLGRSEPGWSISTREELCEWLESLLYRGTYLSTKVELEYWKAEVDLALDAAPGLKRLKTLIDRALPEGWFSSNSGGDLYERRDRVIATVKAAIRVLNAQTPPHIGSSIRFQIDDAVNRALLSRYVTVFGALAVMLFGGVLYGVHVEGIVRSTENAAAEAKADMARDLLDVNRHIVQVDTQLDALDGRLKGQATAANRLAAVGEDNARAMALEAKTIDAIAAENKAIERDRADLKHLADAERAYGPSNPWLKTWVWLATLIAPVGAMAISIITLVMAWIWRKP